GLDTSAREPADEASRAALLVLLDGGHFKGRDLRLRDHRRRDRETHTQHQLSHIAPGIKTFPAAFGLPRNRSFPLSTVSTPIPQFCSENIDDPECGCYSRR